jgi:manganese/iron transport system ATP-binding protein
VILVSTHNLGSVPEFCDRAVLLNRTVLAAGLTEEVFTQANLEKAFGGVLRHFVFDAKLRAGISSVDVISDDERPLVIYADKASDATRDSTGNPSAAQEASAPDGPAP